MASSLDPFLRLDLGAARRQWDAVLRREFLPRQADFLPIEVILCFGLFHVIDPHKYGGANIHTIPMNVQLLAALLRRSPGSLTSKMLNLDGSRANAGRHEPELFLFLSTHRDEFFRLHRMVLQAALDAGIEVDDVDLMGGDASASLELLGQDEVGTREIDVALQESSAERKRLTDGSGLPEGKTERLVEQKVRIGQHRFARDVLSN